MSKSSIMQTAIAVTLVAILVASETIAASNVRVARVTKGASVQKNAINTIPVSSNTRRRRLEDDSDPKKSATTDESKMPKESTDETAGAPPKDTKQAKTDEKAKKDDKAKKQMEASNFEQLKSSNDCQVESVEANRIDIECMATASAAVGNGAADPKGDNDKKDKKDKKSKTNNKIEYTIKTGRDGISLTVDYDDSMSLADNKPTQYMINYDRVIEYQKKGDGRGWFGGGNSNAADTNMTSNALAYDFDSDDVVQTIALDSWSDIEEVVLGSSATKPTGTKYYSAKTSDGTVVFNFFVNSAAEGQDVTANKVKIDFWVTDFPFRKESDSYIALMSTVNSQQSPLGYKAGKKSKKESSTTTDDSKAGTSAVIVFKDYDEKEVTKITGSATSTDAFYPVGEYTWATSAKAFGSSSTSTGGGVVTSIESSESTSSSGNGLTVVATSPTNENDPTLQLAFSFISKGESSVKSIYWDPEVGIGYASPSDTIVSNNDVLAGTPSAQGTGASTTTSAADSIHMFASVIASMIASFLLL